MDENMFMNEMSKKAKLERRTNLEGFVLGESQDEG
jgi:hypothetical protein